MRPAFSASPDLNPNVLESISGFLIDWDGCCALDNKILPGAIRFLKQNEDRVAIVSNTSTDTPASFEAILKKEGITLPEDRIILAGILAIDLAADTGLKRVDVLGAPTMLDYAQSTGLTVSEESAEAVILMRDVTLSYDRLERAANHIAAGARLIVANPDLTHPGENGRIKPETGALLAALQACINLQSCSIEIVGKPRSEIFQHALGKLGVPSSAALMIGDNPTTDIAGANNVGMRGLLVGKDPSKTLNELADYLEAL